MIGFGGVFAGQTAWSTAVWVGAPGAACTAFTPDTAPAQVVGDLVFRVRLPLDMPPRVQGTAQ